MNATDDGYIMQVGYDDTFPDEGSNILIWTSSASIAASFLVILYILLVSKKGHKIATKLALYINVSNALSAMGTCVGYQEDKSVLCYWEAALSTVFPQCTAAWTIVVIVALYQIVASGKQLQINLFIHAFCWGFPTLLTFLLYINARLGNPNDGSAWCFIALQDSVSSVWLRFWYYLSFYAFQWIVIFLSFIFYLFIFNEYRKINGPGKHILFTSCKKLICYPFMIIISWGLVCLTDSLISSYSILKGFNLLQNIGDALAGSQGKI